MIATDTDQQNLQVAHHNVANNQMTDQVLVVQVANYYNSIINAYIAIIYF